MEDRASRVDVAVVGGGLGGLAAAAYAARGGRERRAVREGVGARRPGDDHAAGRVPLQPRPACALCRRPRQRGRCASSACRSAARKPSASGAFAIARGAKHALPGGFLSLLTTGLFGLPAKLETARLLAGFGAHRSERRWRA